MICPICESAASGYCSAQVLGKYQVQYFRCNACQFIFTEDPYWLDEAYGSAITQLDIGLVQRNEITVPVVQTIINTWFDANGRFIDYGGGYGLLVRMMRDRGYNYYRQDIHCENLFAKLFDVSDVPPFRAELLTAFEVFEHLVNPVEELKKMLALSDTILFSTTIQPAPDVNPDSWWYFTTETGQHIALYSRASLQALAARFGLHYYWNSKDIHLFTKKTIDRKLFKFITHPRLSSLYTRINTNRATLLQSDFAMIKKRLQSKVF